MRNWPKTVPGASFKGFPFELEGEGTDDAGRLVALHPFVKAEDHGTEDMGRKARKFHVVAYIVGDDADSQAAAFVEVCSSPGAGMLILPMTPGTMVRCIDCSTHSEKTKQGYVAFSLKFVEQGADAGGFPAIVIGDRIAASVLDTLPSLISGAISRIPLQ